MKGKRYTKEFKEQAVKMTLEEDRTAREVSESLGVSYFSLREWRKEYLKTNRESLRKNGKISAEEEVKLLKKENNDLKMENVILKKFAAILSKDQ
jgi:transposase